MTAMPDAFPTSLDSDAADLRAAQAAQHAARTIIGTVRVAQALTDCDRVVDLTGLDGSVGVLCAQILDLAPEAARSLLPVLVDLQACLDSLDAVIQRAGRQ